MASVGTACYPPPAVAQAVYLRVPHEYESKQREPAISRDLRINQTIRVPQVRVLDEDGQQLGVMPTVQALGMAQERGLDLVEVAPTAAPPVVKFLDFGQYRYELAKREKEAKRKQRAVEFKEVRLTPKIGTGDFETKVHRAIEFLEDGDRIKVTVRFRGRELTHPEIGRGLLAKFSEAVKDHGTVDRSPALEGKSMFMTLASVHKPRVHEHKLAGSRPEGADEAPGEALQVTPEESSQPAPAAAAAPAPEPQPAVEAPAEAPEAPVRPAPQPTPAPAPAAEAAPAGE
jgi:translation initiation factor IF-3